MTKNYFTKSLSITAGVLIPLIVILFGVYFIFFKKDEIKPLKPEKKLYSIEEEINYGVANFKVLEFKKELDNAERVKAYSAEHESLELINDSKSQKTKAGSPPPFLTGKNWGETRSEELKKMEDANNIERIDKLSAIKIKVTNSYTNKDKIYITEQQFLIRDNDRIIEPIIFNDSILTPSIRGTFLSSGEELVGYIFFEEIQFDSPILEINPFSGSLPIKVKLY